jgi:hypothetical protein
MNKRNGLAAVVLVLCGLTLVSHGVDAVKQEQRPYDTVSRVVQPGQSLWDICARLDSSEDIRAVIDRTRVDNNITDPRTLQPGRVITIRYKR